MDPNGHIYRAPEDEIPEADKARLEGFLQGRAEADAPKRAEAATEVERLRKLIEERESRPPR